MKLHDNYDRIFFTSDHHFGHNNIIKYSKRPFKDAGEMDAALIKNWNDIVGSDDLVFHLGDVTFGDNARDYFAKLNGKIYVLCLDWHHDKHWLKKEQRQEPMRSKTGYDVTLLGQIAVLSSKALGQSGYPLAITLSHYPLAQWEASFHGAWQLHGHSHGTYLAPEDRFCLDVGVDCTNYAPISLTDVIDRMKVRGW